MLSKSEARELLAEEQRRRNRYRPQVGKIQPGQTDWTLMRPPVSTVEVKRSTLDRMQAELALLQEIKAAADAMIEAHDPYKVSADVNAAMLRLLALVRRYDGWTGDLETRDEVVESLLHIAEDLGDA